MVYIVFFSLFRPSCVALCDQLKHHNENYCSAYTGIYYIWHLVLHQQTFFSGNLQNKVQRHKNI